MLSPKLNIALNRKSTKTAEDREPEKFWLNIGEFAEYQNEDGETERQFISLNYGIPLSSVPDMKKGNNIFWNAVCDAKDGLRDQLLELAQGLQPGETIEFPITIQLRHVGERPEITPDENPMRVKLRV